jgi:hypothetical protein
MRTKSRSRVMCNRAKLLVACEMMILLLLQQHTAKLESNASQVTGPIIKTIEANVFEGGVRTLDQLRSTMGQAESNRWVSDGGALSGPLLNFDGTDIASQSAGEAPDGRANIVDPTSFELDPIGDVGPSHYVAMINSIPVLGGLGRRCLCTTSITPFLPVHFS